MSRVVDKYLSNKISVLSFVAMIGVLLIHSTYSESSQWPWLFYIQRYFSSLSNCAVPFFFIISGYFYFLKISDFKSIKSAINKRKRTLLVPYLIWCLIFILSVSLVSLIISLNYDYLIYLKQGKFCKFLVYVFWTPAAFHLWYIRDLMIVILISPLIYHLLKKWPEFTLVVSYILFGYFRVAASLSWALWWIILGGYFGIKHIRPLCGLPKFWSVICLLIGLISVGVFLYYGLPLTPEYRYTIPVLLLCIIGFWSFYDYLNVKVDRAMIVADFTFAIYCAHIPLLNILKKAFFPLGGNSWGACLAGYVLSPVITIVIICVVCVFIKSKCPKLYNILYGGR